MFKYCITLSTLFALNFCLRLNTLQQTHLHSNATNLTVSGDLQNLFPKNYWTSFNNGNYIVLRNDEDYFIKCDKAKGLAAEVIQKENFRGGNLNFSDDFYWTPELIKLSNVTINKLVALKSFYGSYLQLLPDNTFDCKADNSNNVNTHLEVLNQNDIKIMNNATTTTTATDTNIDKFISFRIRDEFLAVETGGKILLQKHFSDNSEFCPLE